MIICKKNLWSNVLQNRPENDGAGCDRDFLCKTGGLQADSKTQIHNVIEELLYCLIKQ